jgi:hypothetical protein
MKRALLLSILAGVGRMLAFLTCAFLVLWAVVFFSAWAWPELFYWG